MQSSAATASPLVSLSPSFNTYSSSDRLAQIAARVVNELTSQDHHDSDTWQNVYDHHEEEETRQQQQQPENDAVHAAEDEEDEEEEFEFAFVGREAHASPISADEIFSNGQIRPVYPLFNQDLLLDDNDGVSSKNVFDAVKDTKPKQRRLPLRMLMIEEERETASCSSSEADDLENLSPGTYCVWAPPKASPGRQGCNKSSSTGSSKRWKFRDLLYRSSSDGKDTFVFLAPSTKKADNNNKDDDVARKRVGGVARNEADKRRSFLPYRQDFGGFFSNVNGLSRNLHPF